MKLTVMKPGQGVLARVTATLVLSVSVLIIWLATGQRGTPVTPDWWSDVTSGLLVLAVAGIWVSFFAERQAARSIKDDIDARFSILSSSLQARISDIYYEEVPDVSNRANQRLRARVVTELDRARGDVRVLAIAARELFHEGQGFAFQSMQSLMRDQHQRAGVRILLIHPLSEQAVSRALREDLQHRDFACYRSSRLYTDVLQSCEFLVQRASSRVEVRLYKVFPACFLLLVNDAAFVEQYHFGTGGRASGKVPLYEVAKGGTCYGQFEGHFEHVWAISKPYALTRSLVDTLNSPDREQWGALESSLRFSRPDLFL